MSTLYHPPVRTLTDDNGDPWFVAKDVCDALGIVNPSRTLSGLDSDEKSTCPSQYEGQIRHLTTINESGLYSLILRSRKPEAKTFKKWITSEVLPAIRLHDMCQSQQR
ncbi:hypothetical protein SYK_23930 [Pseudodesulfovibrio nedwellii]|uniref:Bro-N domain-containing protein n=1 Tax=Pseudodesulfovibrio nedwellii TaxID=2973072 RepID=A0ABM8B2I2_9BACT|nr:Bro-N domain-containing protein [Pseudodesulfovibrio nedwellii]BDQ38033.1 hypothetical protein SYK_23930 [Pseudodesulfovibrio nedwellii]